MTIQKLIKRILGNDPQRGLTLASTDEPSHSDVVTAMLAATGVVYRGVMNQAGTAAPTVSGSYTVHNPLSLTNTPARTSAGLYTFAITGWAAAFLSVSGTTLDVSKIKVNATSMTAARLINYVSWAVTTSTLTITVQISDNVTSGATLAAADVLNMVLEVSHE